MSPVIDFPITGLCRSHEPMFSFEARFHNGPKITHFEKLISQLLFDKLKCVLHW